MKKVINGKLYNTETAQKLAEYSNGFATNDFSYFEETLYRNRAGAHFIHGFGGGNSKYGEWRGNSGGSGEKIIPLTLAEAKEWAEACLDGDEYERIFGEIEDTEGEQIVPLTVKIPESLLNALKARKEETGKTVTALVISALEKALGVESNGSQA